MSQTMTAGVNSSNILVDAWQMPFNLASAIVAADVGKAVSIDTTAAFTVKLAADNDEIIGRLETFEDRTVEGLKTGTVAMQGIMVFPTVVTVPALGDNVAGGGSGQVKTATAPGTATAAALVRVNTVIARDATNRLVTVIIR
jgi:hypothetical protein